MSPYLTTTLTECQRRLVRAASKNYRYYLTGTVTHDKLERMATKFEQIYHVNRNASQNVYYQKTHGDPAHKLIVWQGKSALYWWVLATDFAFFEQQNETFFDLHQSGQRLTLEGRFQLKRTPVPKTERVVNGKTQLVGGGHSVSFYFTKRYYEEHRVNIEYLSSSHGTEERHQRIDDLRREVDALLMLPMWRGVRSQVHKLLTLSVKAWEKTHLKTSPYPIPLPERLPYLTPVSRKKDLSEVSDEP